MHKIPAAWDNLTSSRAETSKKKYGPNRSRNDFFCSNNVVRHPDKLVCFLHLFEHIFWLQQTSLSTAYLYITNISLSIVSVCINFILVGKSLFTLDPSKRDEAIDLITKISDRFTDVSLKVTYHTTRLGSI